MSDVFDQVNPAQNPSSTMPTQPSPATPAVSTPNAGGGDIFDQVNPSQSSSTPNTPPVKPSSNIPPVPAFNGARTGEGEGYLGPGSFARQFYTGVGKEAAQVGHTVGGLINKATGNRVSWLPTDTKEPDNLKPQGIAEKEGALGENIAEFILTDGAAKGISVLDRLGVAKKLTDLAQSSPTVAKLIGLGLSSAKNAGIVAGQDVAHGRPENAGRDAALTTATTLGGGAVSAAAKNAPQLWDTITGKAIQSKLQTAIRSTLSDTASASNIGHLPTGDLRDSANDVADNLETQAKALYKKIDDATQGEFTNIQNKIKNVETKLRDIAGTDDDAEEKLYNQKIALNVKMDEAIDAAKKAGVNPSVADQARDTWKQMSAMRDVDSQIKAAMPGAKQASGEMVDPTQFANRVQKLYDSGRLQTAVGPKNAKQMLITAREAVSSTNKLQAAKTIAKYGAYGAGLTIGGGILSNDVQKVLTGH